MSTEGGQTRTCRQWVGSVVRWRGEQNWQTATVATASAYSGTVAKVAVHLVLPPVQPDQSKDQSSSHRRKRPQSRLKPVSTPSKSHLHRRRLDKGNFAGSSSRRLCLSFITSHKPGCSTFRICPYHHKSVKLVPFYEPPSAVLSPVIA